MLAAASCVLVAACAGTTDADVSSSGDATTIASTAPAPSTTGVPQTTIPPAGTGDGDPVTIAFGGDIHYEGSLATTLAKAPDTMLAGVGDALATADLAVVNLETAVTSGGQRQEKAFAFSAPPEAFDSLRAGGADVISMANDHGMDYGPSGLAQTMQAVAEKSAPVIGIGNNESEAYRPFTAEVKGQRISVIAATQVLDSSLVAAWTATPTQGGVSSAKRIDRLVQAVTEARGQSDTVVVFLHWGTDKTLCPNTAQIDLAEKLVAAGADIVAGGHSHRVQGGGYLGDSYVHYGLGNLQFKAGSADARESGVLVVTVTGRRVDAAEWRPARIGADYLPVLETGTGAEASVARWNGRRDCTGLSGTAASAPSTTAPSTTATSPGA